jgi:hypothetical protein
VSFGQSFRSHVSGRAFQFRPCALGIHSARNSRRPAARAIPLHHTACRAVAPSSGRTIDCAVSGCGVPPLERLLATSARKPPRHAVRISGATVAVPPLPCCLATGALDREAHEVCSSAAHQPRTLTRDRQDYFALSRALVSAGAAVLVAVTHRHACSRPVTALHVLSFSCAIEPEPVPAWFCAEAPAEPGSGQRAEGALRRGLVRGRAQALA